MSKKESAAQPVSDHKPNSVPEAARISAKMRTTLQHMAQEGVDLTIAAQRAGMNVEAAKNAFRRPHVKAALNQMIKEVRDNAAQMAYLRINKISQDAKSDRTRLDANKWLAGVDGISPVQKVEGNHRHNVTFGGFEYSGPEPVDVTPENSESPDDEA